jgi:hypothetical protein
VHKFHFQLIQVEYSIDDEWIVVEIVFVLNNYKEMRIKCGDTMKVGLNQILELRRNVYEYYSMPFHSIMIMN